MQKSKVIFAGILTVAIFMSFTAAQAAPEDDEAVAKARVEYEQAMKGSDVGLQNAMKIQLSVQISKSKAGKNVVENNNSKPDSNKSS